ncbi:MAG: hypothetical protein JNL90_12415 [Planctomycetes bacterium]|nr:hypothetical protein [Planctomycetota bacterium]
MDAMRILAAGVLLGGATFGQGVERAAKSDTRSDKKSDATRDAQSSSSRSVSVQRSSDVNGVKSTTSAKRTEKDGVVVEESGDPTLLDELMKSGVHIDDLERLVRELAKLDRPALPSGGALGDPLPLRPGKGDGKPVVRRVVKVAKGGSGAEGGCDPLPSGSLPGFPRGLPAGPLAGGELGDLADLRSLGFDVTGLEELIEQTVADALAGRLPDPKELERRAQRIRVNGAPVDVQTEVLSGAEALAELERRCPELAGELDELLREVGGSLDCEFARQSSHDAASSSDSRRSSDRSRVRDADSTRDADRSRDAERNRSGTVAPADPTKRVAPTPPKKPTQASKPATPAKPSKPAAPIREIGA